MKYIYRVIFGSPGNSRVFFSKGDEDRFLDYARIYKDRFSIKVLAYSLKSDCANLIIYDRKNLRDKYTKNLSEAYEYYLKLGEREGDLRIVTKLLPLDSRSEFIKLMGFLHSEGRHSLKSYEKYTRYVEDELLDIGLVLNSLDYPGREKKDLFVGELDLALTYSDKIDFKKHEEFKRDKIIKRRERAIDFFDKFLEELSLDKGEFLNGNFEEEKRLLINRFREETDLSFRDIGYVLGISHTTVIRMYKELDEH